MNIYHELAKEKGFHDDDERDADGNPTPRQMLAWLGLIASELWEGDQESCEFYVFNGKPEGKLVETADAIIRCWDACGACGVDANESLDSEVFSVLIAEEDRDYKGTFSFMKAAEFARLGNSKLFAQCLSYWAERAILRESILQLVIAHKHAYNQTRPRKHGKLA